MTNKKQTEEKVDPILMEKAKEIVEKKQKKAKRVKATKELIHGRANRLFDIPIVTDETDDEIIEIVFKAKRLSPRQRAEMKVLNIDTNNIGELSDDELAELEKQGYELLAKVIVDPEYSPEEWEDVDIALTQALVNKASILQYEANDAKAIESFRNS
jgi:hypothetical protein